MARRPAAGLAPRARAGAARRCRAGRGDRRGTELAARLARDGVPVRAVAVDGRARSARAAGLVAELRGARHSCTPTTPTPSRWAASGPGSRAGRSSPRDGSISRSAGAASGRGRTGSSRSPRAVADVLASDGIARDRIAVVHSGIDLDELRAPPRLGVRGRLGLPARCDRRRQCRARWSRHKDHATLSRAAALLASRFPGAPLGRGGRRPRPRSASSGFGPSSGSSDASTCWVISPTRPPRRRCRSSSS